MFLKPVSVAIGNKGTARIRGSVIQSQLIIAIVTATVMHGCAKTHAVRPLGTNHPASGLVYSLPRTVLRVIATPTLVSYEKGPCSADIGNSDPAVREAYDNARSLYGLPSPLSSGETSVAISGWNIERYSEPDPDARFVVDLETAGNATLMLAWDDAGNATSFSSSSTDRVADITMETVGSIAQLVGRFFGSSAALTPAAPPNQDISEQCRNAFSQINIIQASYFALRENSANGGEQSVVDSSVASLSSELRAAYGRVTNRKYTTLTPVRCDVRLEANERRAGTVELFSFGTTPAQFVFTSEECTYDLRLPRASNEDSVEENSVSLNWSIVSDPPIQQESTSEVRGFYFREPVRVAVRLEQQIASSEGRTLAVGNVISIAQMGLIRSLPRVRTRRSAKVLIEVGPDGELR